ncbi:hypothetical protein [Arthrobacter sp. CAN_C5]|uniref:hypothetical protein n=1 Tax=Arthrobacter sp. CAN_C5 TaxID=2760706 RepID=UPI001AE2B455|nr:hypothetical protein [Arthrobacter sp. CAN_C5]MBP2216050.1 hypothetical protein [Arthrobacter sp. CAN_C5]
MTSDYEDGWFRAMLKTGLGHLGSVSFDGQGPCARVKLTQSSGRILVFEQSIAAIHERIAIDEETRHAMWPDFSLAAASVALLSIHVEEALKTAAAAQINTLSITDGSVTVSLLQPADLQLS